MQSVLTGIAISSVFVVGRGDERTSVILLHESKSVTETVAERWYVMQKSLQAAKGIIKQVLDLSLVCALATGSDRAGRRSRCDEETLASTSCLLHCGLQTRLDIAVRAVVERLLLRPHDLGVRVLLEGRYDHIVRYGRNLLNSRDGNVCKTTLLALSQEGIVNLTAAQLDVVKSVSVNLRVHRVRLTICRLMFSGASRDSG